MQGKVNTVWIIFRWVIALSLLLNYNIVLGDSNIQITVVKSSENSYFNQTIQTLINQTDKSANISVLNLESSPENLDSLKDSELIIALGASATQAIRSVYPDKLLISAYLTEEQFKKLKLQGKRHLSVLLDQPLTRYLAFSHLILDAKAVGIVNYVETKLNRKQRRLLKQLDVKLKQYQLERPQQLLTRIRQLIEKNGTLLMLPDQTIYNRDTLKGVLLTTYRSRTPVISYSPAHVKSGALASIYSSPADIGKHLGELLNEYLLRKTIPENSIEYARYYSVKFNQRVAHALGLLVPDNQKLRARLDEVMK